VSATAHPLFTGGADALWTQQSRDCGQMGDYISAGPDFFFKATTTPSASANVSDVWIRGRRFLREFAKYRYGVFDLNERTGAAAEQDGLFPDFFCVGGPSSPAAAASASNATGRSIQSARSSDCDNSSNCLNTTTSSTSFTAVSFLNNLFLAGNVLISNFAMIQREKFGHFKTCSATSKIRVRALPNLTAQ
jgi:hypothetical protein